MSSVGVSDHALLLLGSAPYASDTPVDLGPAPAYDVELSAVAFAYVVHDGGPMIYFATVNNLRFGTL